MSGSGSQTLVWGTRDISDAWAILLRLHICIYMTLNAISQVESSTGRIAFQIEEVRERVKFLNSWEKSFGVICSGSEVVFPVQFSCASLGKGIISPSASVQLFKQSHSATPSASCRARLHLALIASFGRTFGLPLLTEFQAASIWLWLVIPQALPLTVNLDTLAVRKC